MKKLYLLLITFSLINTICTAQSIPNSGFENWTNMGTYYEPDGWGTLNSLTSALSVYTVTRGNPGNPGSYYIKVTSKNAGAMGVVPGIAVSGNINSASMTPESGFPFSQRPATLTGSWQHMIFGSSQGYIDVLLTRWDGNQRIVVANAHRTLTGMAMNWATFNIPLNYLDGNNPDSCMIVLAASGAQPTNGDYLWIDNMTFSGTVTNTEEQDMTAGMQVFPNPVNEKLTLHPIEGQGKISELKIMDISGKVIMQFHDSRNTTDMTLEVRDLPKGTFLLSGRKDEHIFLLKFIKE
ncbi:MAG: T9SS type A sorting domain-containing protein [Bacteroidetes bacterium]|nr:T9SS type A sorting domain-containing protein [Bacteroidota bacterium]